MEENKELMVNTVEETENEYEVVETGSGTGKVALIAAAGAAALAGLAFGAKKGYDKFIKPRFKKSEQPEVVEEINEDSNEESK